jgi:hypothetical protein
MKDSDLTTADIPPIYVSPAGYDDMGLILDRLGVDYEPTGSATVSNLDTAVVMINCKTTWITASLIPSYRALASDFRTFVHDGGSGIVSDLAGSVITKLGAEFATESWSDSVDARVVHDELAELLGRRSVTLDLQSAVNKPTQLPADSTVFIREAGSGDPLAYQFSHGNGNIVYTSFHNHEQTSEVEEALFQLLLLVPISSTIEASVTDTYTTLVEKPNTTFSDPSPTDATGAGDTTESTSNTGSTSPPSVRPDPKSTETQPDSRSIRCSACGAMNDPENTFCKRSSCGKRLE